MFYYLQSAFTIWMLVDCVRSRRDAYWYLIAFVPFGPVVYFLAVKLDDFDTRWVRRLFVRTPSLDALRYAARETPSFANRIRLAEALHDAGHVEEAAPLFEQALRSDAKDRAALHGLGRCRVAMGDLAGGIETLTDLVDRDLSFRDYAAALDLAAALQDADRAEDAVELLEEVSRKSTILAHRVVLARALVDLGRTDEARAILHRGLDDTFHAPSYIRRRDRRATREASALLTQLRKGAPAARETEQQGA